MTRTSNRLIINQLLYHWAITTICQDVRTSVVLKPFESQNATRLIPFTFLLLSGFSGCRFLSFTLQTSLAPLSDVSDWLMYPSFFIVQSVGSWRSLPDDPSVVLFAAPHLINHADLFYYLQETWRQRELGLRKPTRAISLTTLVRACRHSLFFTVTSNYRYRSHATGYFPASRKL